MKTVTRVGVFILIAFLAVPLFLASSASFPKSPSPKSTTKQAVSSTPGSVRAKAQAIAPDLKRMLEATEAAAHPLLPLLQAPPPPETVSIYESDCTTAATEFELGQTLCAKVTGAPTPLRTTQVLRRLNIVTPDGYIVSEANVTGNDETVIFTLPTDQTSEISGETKDNRGQWSASSTTTTNGRAVVSTPFTVKDPANPAVDLVVTKVVAGSQEVSAGAEVPFSVFVTNYGPDDAANVEVTDAVPTNTTFVSASRNSGASFTCSNTSGTPKCTIASLPSGGTAQLTFVFEVSAGASPGTSIDNTAQITSDTAETFSPDNASTASATVTAGGGGGEDTCTLSCPADKVVTANATQGGQSGAFVTYGAAGVTGNCGSVTNTPVSGSFFTVGTHTVTSTSSTGATCTFTVRVLDTPAPTITCPADKFATAEAGSDEANVTVGTPTFTASGGGTVVGVRSDSVPDVPKALTDPYPVGTIEITWTVTDADGRTASCRQKITVTGSGCATDTEDPTITAPPDVTVGTGPGNTGCSVALDDELGQAEASDNCSVTVTISGIPPGNAFSPGTYTLTYTATDGAGHTASDTQVVTVVDDTPPVIVAPDDASYVCPSEVPAGNPSQATRGDVFDQDGNLLPPGPPFDNCSTPVVTVVDTNNGGAGSASSPLVITRTYTATDAAGNSSSDSQTITVIDSTPPTLALNGANPMTVECHTSFTDPGATASDNCSAPFAATPSGTVDVNTVGTYTITYNASDAAGNAATPITRTVIVQDTTKPVITLNGANPMTVECHTSFTDPGATAADSCDTSVPVSASGSVNINVPGTYTLTYNATDDSGNNADTVTRTVNVVDTTPPTITLNGVTPSMWPANHKYKTFQVTDFVTGASDSCDTPLSINNVVIEKVTSDEAENGNGDGNTLNDIIIGSDCKSVQLRAERDGSANGRVYTITFLLRDASGNATRVTAKVVVPHNVGTTPVDNGPVYTRTSSCQ